MKPAKERHKEIDRIDDTANTLRKLSFQVFPITAETYHLVTVQQESTIQRQLSVLATRKH